MKRIVIFTITLFSIINGIYAQGKFGHVTPQAADFIKYGDVPVSLFTGKMNLEVPIYHIKDNDFEIPID